MQILDRGKSHLPEGSRIFDINRVVADSKRVSVTVKGASIPSIITEITHARQALADIDIGHHDGIQVRVSGIHLAGKGLPVRSRAKDEAPLLVVLRSAESEGEVGLVPVFVPGTPDLSLRQGRQTQREGQRDLGKGARLPVPHGR